MDICITGVGICSAIGQGKEAFLQALLNGQHQFDYLKRPGRQLPEQAVNQSSAQSEMPLFMGAEIESLQLPDNIGKGFLRTTSLSTQAAIACLDEVWHEAALHAVAAERIGLIVGGSNLQQRELVNIQDKFQTKKTFLRPTYAMAFMDTDIIGCCTELYPVKGGVTTVGAASASGQVAIIQGIQLVLSGQLDCAVVIGGLMDLSYWECQALRSVGAMGSTVFADNPSQACRPFDTRHDGFIYGEACGAVVIESVASAEARQQAAYARVSGWATAMAGNRNPDPSEHTEKQVMLTAIEKAQLSAAAIDYINPHGTGSPTGDAVELSALAGADLNHAFINATKSITGHGLTAAGCVEVIATLLQMQAGQLHPTLNLEEPLSHSFHWVGEQPINHHMQHALTLSYGFGGINSALVLSRF
ncbi:beta-ketoacyl synthase N-terminal-like domain-containing protein [Aliikangiella maris]|uniref:Beta-ketoacyl synthase N-terminal-like domain-containing protein n=2 Tax=Aliikangiella maris TaxID=3162458 RepID=A0ABV2BU28_9GAMM